MTSLRCYVDTVVVFRMQSFNIIGDIAPSTYEISRVVDPLRLCPS